LVNDREIMGDLVSPLWANILALGVVVILVGAGVLFGVSVVAPHTLALIGGK
jgi:Mn2+/Fe2+ NRAMP family transporter